ncbi:hypothetical protein BJX64DRAFT_257787 [Aspergillus heterothallicus]
MSTAELACSYASLILADEGIEITADKLQTLLTAAKVQEVEPIWTSIFAKALEGKDIKDLLTNVGSAGAAAPAAAGGAAPAAGGDAAAPAEEKEEGKQGLRCIEPGIFWSLINWLQRRRSPTRTWASVSSTKRLAHPRSASRLFFLFVFLTSLLSDLASSPPPYHISLYPIQNNPHEDQNWEKAKTKNLRTRTSFGLGAVLCMMDPIMAEILDRMTLGFRLLGA